MPGYLTFQTSVHEFRISCVCQAHFDFGSQAQFQFVEVGKLSHILCGKGILLIILLPDLHFELKAESEKLKAQLQKLSGGAIRNLLEIEEILADP